MCSITIPGNATNCRACKEAMELLKHKKEQRDNFLLAITFESGATHYHVPISMVQMEKLNNQYKFLK
jgi:hypothetical protein